MEPERRCNNQWARLCSEGCVLDNFSLVSKLVKVVYHRKGKRKTGGLCRYSAVCSCPLLPGFVPEDRHSLQRSQPCCLLLKRAQYLLSPLMCCLIHTRRTRLLEFLPFSRGAE